MTINIEEFNDLMSLGKVTRTLKLLEGKFEIVMETVPSGVYAKAMERIPGGLPDGKRMEALQREVISAAIKTINGKNLSLEDKSLLLEKSQLGLENLLYTEYLGMIEEQSTLLEGAKKNS